MFLIRIRVEPFNFGLPVNETDPDPGSKEISQNQGKFPQKIYQKPQEYHVFFKKILNFNLTDINIYLINNKLINFFGEIYF